jgi:HD-GYP domain-containing protein (c-di-GMP phosphodiesterase class II)/DNA-binding CsgD family transcriptional regulator
MSVGIPEPGTGDGPCDEDTTTDGLRFADLLTALSVVTDLGMGRPPGKAVRACLVAMGLARHLGLDEPSVGDVYYTSLLRHLGCTATATEEAHLYGGDELVSRPPGESTDFGDRREMARLFLAIGRGTGIDRARYLARTLRAGKAMDALIFGSLCEVAARLAARLELPPGVVTGVAEVFERWDGTGAPRGLKGEEIGVPARLTEIAHQVVIFDLVGGPEGALAMVRRRAGGWFDPRACEAFEEVGIDLLAGIASSDEWQLVLDVEPEPVMRIPPWRIDPVARCFADMIDLKTHYTLGHSSGVADLAEAAARELGLGEQATAQCRLAGLLHDLGRAGVSNGVWDKRAALRSVDREQVRLHPYYTERVLSRSTALRPLVPVAGMHHERQDGSGYHHQASGRTIPVGARVLAAADVFQAMTQPRPHRPALDTEQAAAHLTAEVAAGRLDAECAGAVLTAAGHTRPVPTSWPAGLTDREVEVLRLVARGLTNREIAERLFVSRRTAEHHVQHIYDKVGMSTRAGAAMYAMEHDLLRSPATGNG